MAASWIAVVLAASTVAVVRHGEPATVRASAPEPSSTTVPATTAAPPPVTEPPTTTTTAAPTRPTEAAAADAPPAPAPGGDGGEVLDPLIGSALDIHPGPVEPRASAACVDPGSVTAPPGLVVLDVGARCLRVLAGSDELPSRDVGWSPDGSWLLTTLAGHLTRIAADGSWRQDLGGGGQVESAALSPDGTRIAVTGNRPCCYLAEKRVLVVANSDGTGERLAQDDIALAVQPPVWSADSQRFAYVNSPTPGPSAPQVLRVFDAAGDEQAETSLPDRGSTDARTGAPTPTSFGRLHWTRDGSLAVPVFVDRPARQSLAWFDAGLDEIAGPANPPFLVGALSSTPDGRNVLYQAFDPDHGSYQTAVWTVSRDTGDAKQVATGEVEPVLSPDGARYAFATIDPDQQPPVPLTVSVADLAGRVTPLWTVSQPHCTCWLDHPPAWSPDGALLAIATSGG